MLCPGRRRQHHAGWAHVVPSKPNPHNPIALRRRPPTPPRWLSPRACWCGWGVYNHGVHLCCRLQATHGYPHTPFRPRAALVCESPSSGPGGLGKRRLRTSHAARRKRGICAQRRQRRGREANRAQHTRACARARTPSEAGQGPRDRKVETTREPCREACTQEGSVSRTDTYQVPAAPSGERENTVGGHQTRAPCLCPYVACTPSRTVLAARTHVLAARTHHACCVLESGPRWMEACLASALSTYASTRTTEQQQQQRHGRAQIT